MFSYCFGHSNQLDGMNLFIVECPMFFSRADSVYFLYYLQYAERLVSLGQFHDLRSLTYRRGQLITRAPYSLNMATGNPYIYCCHLVTCGCIYVPIRYRSFYYCNHY